MLAVGTANGPAVMLCIRTAHMRDDTYIVGRSRYSHNTTALYMYHSATRLLHEAIYLCVVLPSMPGYSYDRLCNKFFQFPFIIIHSIWCRLFHAAECCCVWISCPFMDMQRIRSKCILLGTHLPVAIISEWNRAHACVCVCVRESVLCPSNAEADQRELNVLNYLKRRSSEENRFLFNAAHVSLRELLINREIDGKCTDKKEKHCIASRHTRQQYGASVRLFLAFSFSFYFLSPIQLTVSDFFTCIFGVKYVCFASKNWNEHSALARDVSVNDPKMESMPWDFSHFFLFALKLEMNPIPIDDCVRDVRYIFSSTLVDPGKRKRLKNSVHLVLNYTLFIQ